MQTVTELLNLLFRWIHVIAAIMWIGNSLLFNWLDRNLRPRDEVGPGSQGKIWLLHSGGFYDVEKTLEPHVGLPRPLHWFKWQAYTTWLTGAALLVVVYYSSASAMLVGPARAMHPHLAITLSVGVLVVGWIVYELMWRSPLARLPVLGALVSFALLLALTYLLLQIFTGRAAFLHIGSLLGTLMAANVFTTIMPSQRQLVAEVERGGSGSATLSELSARAKLRSIHNNYMTFPVIILMMISHFPSAYGHERAWLVLGMLVLGGAWVRHILNVRFQQPRWVPALVAVMLLTVISLYLLIAPRAAPTLPVVVDGEPVRFERVEVIIRQRCTVCHSAAPADRSFGVPAGGVAFDTPAQMRALAWRIQARTVDTHTMPPGNATHMTEAERAVLGAWAVQGPR
jgi:uncharacterized membrane protein